MRRRNASSSSAMPSGEEKEEEEEEERFKLSSNGLLSKPRSSSMEFIIFLSGEFRFRRCCCAEES